MEFDRGLARARGCLGHSPDEKVRRAYDAVRRILGDGELWITEYILTYDGKPSYTVSIMEFTGDRVARETQYFSDPFEPGASRAKWVERMEQQ